MLQHVVVVVKKPIGKFYTEVSPCCHEDIFFGRKCLVVVVKTPFFVSKVLEGGGPEAASKICLANLK